ncbi:DUF4190 domain-containing protein [Streptomyces sp. NPDC054841]
MSDQSDQPPGGYEPRDPWAPPEHRAQQDRVDLGKATPGAQPPRPAVHDQPTVTSMPSAGPFAAPDAGAGTGDAGAGAVPPPPIAPGGPAQTAPGPYGYPAAAAPGVTQPGAPGYGYPGYPGYPGYGQGGWVQGPANGMGITAMVLGIVAVAGFCLYGLGVVLGILALIFGFIGRGRVKRGEATNGGMALAGIILGGVGIVISAAFLGLIIWLIANDPSSLESDEDPWATTLVVAAASR